MTRGSGARAEAPSAPPAAGSLPRRSRARLLAAATHDLLLPVHTMRLLVDLLREDPPAEIRSDALARMAMAAHSTESMLHALLDLARLDGGGLQPALQPVDLDLLLATVCAPFERVCYEVGLRLCWASHSCPPAWADPVLLERCLRNLLDNAAKFTPRGGEIQVQAGRSSTGDTVLIEVRDSGPGFRADERERVFVDGFRGSAARAAGKPGVGLGLGITRQMMQLMQGRIEIAGTAGPGATVHLHLPAGAQRAPFQAASGTGRTQAHVAR